MPRWVDHPKLASLRLIVAVPVTIAEIVWAFDEAVAWEIRRKLRSWLGLAKPPKHALVKDRRVAPARQLPMGERRRYPRTNATT